MHRCFSIEPFVVTQTDSSGSARAVITRVIEQCPVTKTPQINGAFEKFSPRSEQSVRINDSCVLVPAWHQPSAYPDAVRGLKLHIFELSAERGRGLSQAAIHWARSSASNQCREGPRQDSEDQN